MNIISDKTNIRNSKSFRDFIRDNSCFKFTSVSNQVECIYYRQFFVCNARSVVKNLKEHLDRSRHIRATSLRKNPHEKDHQRDLTEK